MKNLAKYLASQGRNGDTELMHVTRGEIAALRGLGSLTGVKVTRNPRTGLPEAFNFRSLIPAAVGLGATVLSGGTLSPLTAGLISGAATTAATGSLQQGLMSGLSGGAIAGLGQGMMAMGGANAASAAGGAGGDAINSASHFSDAGFGANAASSAMDSAPRFSDAAFDAGAAGAAGSTPYSAAMQPYSGPVGAAPAAAASAAPGQFSMNTFMDNAKDPAKWNEQFMDGNKLMGRTAPGLMALSSSIGGAMMPDPGSGSSQGTDESAQKEKRQERTLSMPTDPYYAMHGGEHRYFSAPRTNYADGGGVMSLPTGQQADSGQMKLIRTIRSRYRSRAAAVDDMKIPNSFMQRLGIQDPSDPILDYAFGYTKTQGQRQMRSGDMSMPLGLADGGVVDVGVKAVDPVKRDPRFFEYDKSDMRSGMPVLDGNGVHTETVISKPKKRPTMMADGGEVNGPGDGLSDSVPATINGKRPARLANDEFVVPADAVSGIGNGSSQAGHKQLYDMVARVRAARTGTTRQAPAVNPRKVMPK